MFNARVDAARLADLLAREHDAMAEFLVALAEFDRRRGWEELGYSSLFWFLHRRLGLSKGAAYYRKVAAELVRMRPEVVAPLRAGRLCLMSVVELAKVVTAQNVDEVLPRFFHCSRREAAEVSAAILPMEQPPSRVVVTVASAQPQAATSEAPVRDTPVMVQPVEPLLGVTIPAPTLSVPLTADLRRLHVTVSKRFLAKLDAARDALSHSHPGATTEALLEVGLDLVLARHRERRGIGAAAGAKGRPAAPGRIRATVKREVWSRDAGRCQWPLDGGGICGSTTRLEYDHVVPRGLGGSSDAPNVRLLCRFHNQCAARQVYGDDLMARFAGNVPRASEPVAPWGRGQPRCRNLAMTRFSPIPGKTTVTLAWGPAPSQPRTSPSPSVGCITRSPGAKGARPASGRWSKE